MQCVRVHMNELEPCPLWKTFIRVSCSSAEARLMAITKANNLLILSQYVTYEARFDHSFAIFYEKTTVFFVIFKKKVMHVHW